MCHSQKPFIQFHPIPQQRKSQAVNCGCEDHSCERSGYLWVRGSSGVDCCYLQSLISSTEACTGRPWSGSVLIGYLCSPFIQVSHFAKLRVHQHVRRWGLPRAAFEEVSDYMTTNPAHRQLSISS